MGRTYDRMVICYNEIKALNPTPKEIEKYDDLYGGYEVSTITNNNNYFLRLHNTWGLKRGGRIHIDIGVNQIHLMLDKNTAPEFIDFIKKARAGDR